MRAPLAVADGGVGLCWQAGAVADGLDVLRVLGRANLAVARLFEGHVNAAVAKARMPVANDAFIDGTVPQDWPTKPPDLVVLSEVAYFMTEDENAHLAVRLARDCDCDFVLVNWLGDTAVKIGGADAALRLIRALVGSHHQVSSRGFGRFRIDVLRRTSHTANVARSSGSAPTGN